MLWRQTPTPTCAKRKRDHADEGEAMNSSFQIPSYARITNARVKASGKPHLLTLPTDIREHIFRLALVKPEPIIVCTQNVEAVKEPGLLTVSHDVRQEALKVFYVENEFEMMVLHYNAAALLPWLDKVSRHRERAGKAEEEQNVIKSDAGDLDLSTFSPAQIRLVEKQLIYHAASTTLPPAPTSPCELTGTIPHELNFPNLIAWLQLFHAGKLPGPPRDVEGISPQQAMTFAVFKVVDALRGERWEVVEKMIPGLRAMLRAVEEEWMAE